MKKKLIIAGNYDQALYYATNNRLKRREWMFTDNPAKIRGLRGMEIIRTGFYFENPINDDTYLRFVEEDQ